MLISYILYVESHKVMSINIASKPQKRILFNIMFYKGIWAPGDTVRTGWVWFV